MLCKVVIKSEKACLPGMPNCPKCTSNCMLECKSSKEISAENPWPHRWGSDPWGDFLEARKNAIQWLMCEGDTDKQICKQLSLDERQLYLIKKACKLE